MAGRFGSTRRFCWHEGSWSAKFKAARATANVKSYLYIFVICKIDFMVFVRIIKHI